MSNKRYHSIEEIDQDLQILKLHKDIELEHLKLNYQNARKELHPSNLLGGIGSLVPKVLASLILGKVLKKVS